MSWNYFEEPRTIGFGFEQLAVACRIDCPDSISYWVIDEVEGYRLLEIKVK